MLLVLILVEVRKGLPQEARLKLRRLWSVQSIRAEAEAREGERADNYHELPEVLMTKRGRATIHFQSFISIISIELRVRASHLITWIRLSGMSELQQNCLTQCSN